VQDCGNSKLKTQKKKQLNPKNQTSV
jgi:hypothetical protein